MATGKITKRSVDALAANGRTDFLWDDELRGFGVRITAAGAKSYVYQYRLGGREAPKRRVTIGRHGSPWTPTTARLEADRLAHSVGSGIDPAQQDIERRRQAVDLAFNGYVDLFVEGYLKRAWKDWGGGSRLLKAEAVPVLKAKPLPAIRRADIAAIFDRLGDRPAMARLTFATLRKLFKWAEQRGDVERSPMEGMSAPAAVPARDRVLSEGELILAWRAAGELQYPFGPLIRMLILTGQRREEVAGMTWAEVNRSDGEWNLPASRAKNGKPHIVPLSAPCLALLDTLASSAISVEPGQAPRWPSRGLLFSTTGTTSVSGFSKAKARLDAMMSAAAAEAVGENGVCLDGIKPWRLHDVRRTVATGLQRLGVRFEVTEAVLNHQSGAKSGVAGVYQRHDWKAEKRDALAAWGRWIDRTVSKIEETNVIEIKQRSAAI